MPRDSRRRLARGYGSPRIPAAAQGAIQSNQIGGDRRLTLYELIFVCVKIALCIQHRQKIDETCFVLLGREIHGQLAVRYRIVQPVAALLFLRIADQGVLDLFESVENCGLIADHGLPLTRGLYGDVRTYAATSEQGQTDTRTNRKKVSCAQREIMELSGLTSRCPSEYKARKWIRFCLTDPGCRGGQLRLAAANVRTSLQEIGRQTDIDLRSSGGNRIRFLEFAAQCAGFFSEQNTQAMNRDIDSAEQGRDNGLCGLKLRRRTRYIKLVGQSRFRSGASQIKSLLLRFDILVCNLEPALETP